MAFQYGEGWASAGWEHGCGIEHFTLGRLDCSPPPDCLPWIGSGWIAACVEQLYTLSWICCDIVLEPGPDGPREFTFGGGVSGPTRKLKVRTKLFNKKIDFKSIFDALSFVVFPIGIAISDERAGTYQREIDRFESAIETLDERKETIKDEINFLQDFTDIDVQLRSEFLVDALQEADEFQLDLIAQVEILKLFKRRRQDEEMMIAILMQEMSPGQIIVQ